jgi:hypothetical protein
MLVLTPAVVRRCITLSSSHSTARVFLSAAAGRVSPIVVAQGRGTTLTRTNHPNNVPTGSIRSLSSSTDHQDQDTCDDAVSPRNTTKVMTGTVKFYIREKAYGFIIPDATTETTTTTSTTTGTPPSSKEVWVHRSSLDTPHSPNEFPTRPYLLKNERVRFQIQPKTATATTTATGGERNTSSSDVAMNVRFENGRQVPLYRKNYHAAVVKGEIQRLGQTVYDLCSSSSSSSSSSLASQQQQMKDVLQAVQHAKEQIALAAQKQEQYGPELEEER